MQSITFTRSSTRRFATVCAASFAVICTACSATPDEPLAAADVPQQRVAQTHTDAPRPTPNPPIQTAALDAEEIVVALSAPDQPQTDGFDGDPLMTPWRQYVDGQLIVMYRDGENSPAAKAINKEIGVRVIQPFPAMRGALVELPPGMSVPEAAAAFAAKPGVINVSPNAVADDGPQNVAWH